MSCRNYKNRNYKSALQFAYYTDQDVAATDILTNPLSLQLGRTVTDTGIAFDLNNDEIIVNCSGLYRFSATIDIVGGTAGLVTIAMTLDGDIMQETLKTFDIGVATTETVVSIETIRALQLCGPFMDHRISLIAYTEGTAEGTIASVTGNAVKLA